MSIFKKNLEKNAVKKALNEIQINLENNDKDYEKYKQELAVFHKRMEGYSHRLNVKY